MIKGEVIFRVDASKRIGTGHLIRSLALAQYLRRSGVSIRFLTIPFIPELIIYLKKMKFDIDMLKLSETELGTEKDLKELIRHIDRGTEWVILDNYHFKYDYQARIKEKGLKLLCIDDYAVNRFCSDIVLNHSLAASYLNYRTDRHTKKLLGTDYALLRQDIIEDRAIRKRKSKRKLKNILVTLGGIAHRDIVIKIIKSFKSLLFFKDIEVTILSSILMQDFKSIRRFIGDADNINIKQFSFDIRPFLRWADMAICAAGTTLWELCFYGISGIVGILSENQVMNARLLDKKKIFRSIGWYKGMTVDKLNFYMNDIWKRRDRFFMMREKAFNLVDGLGPQRVFAAMDKISAE